MVEPGADDLTARPWDYPGTPAPCSGLLEAGRFAPRRVADLLDLGRSRTPVVAVGSNASPAVLHRKLSRHGMTGTVPLVAATLAGCAVGHSAHVSVQGFVAAAPFLAADTTTPVYVTLLDEEQVRCVDRTEPNYVRRRVPRDTCALTLEGGTRPDTFDVYDSRWGVIAPPGGAPVPFGAQQALHTCLRDHWPPYAELLREAADAPARDAAGVEGTGDDVSGADGPRWLDLRRIMARLGSEEDLRRRVRDALSATGWARPSGLAAASTPCG